MKKLLEIASRIYLHAHMVYGPVNQITKIVNIFDVTIINI